MKSKIYILGPQGSGKTLLAKKISKRLRIPSFSLDDIYYKKKYTVKRSEDEKKKMLSKILGRRKKWIIEGVATSFVSDAVKQADLVIWLDVDHRLLSYRVIKRQIFRRESLFRLRKLLSEIKLYKNKKGKYKEHKGLLKVSKKYIVLRGRKDIKKCLSELDDQ
ncbi:hypothetical protein CMI42_03875 [Candidatus Pacearchaeota archaeon]|nr:hypothetical protein [Candidatus Pacearchaeota archaeon]